MFKRSGKQPEKPAVSESALADIAVEAWRFGSVLGVVTQRMDYMDAERLIGQYRWFEKKVQTALSQTDIRLVDLTGQAYNVGMAATPLNLDEFDTDDLVVVQMVEPIVMSGGRVIRAGSVMLGSGTAKR